MSSTGFKSSQWNLLHSIHINRRCLWHMFCEAKSQEFQSPFSKFLYIHIEKVCVSNSFHSFQVIPMKLATLIPYVELMFMTYIEAWATCSRVMSLFKNFFCIYRFLSKTSSTVLKLCAFFSYFSWQSGDRGYINVCTHAVSPLIIGLGFAWGPMPPPLHHFTIKKTIPDSRFYPFSSYEFNFILWNWKIVWTNIKNCLKLLPLQHFLVLQNNAQIDDFVSLKYILL